MSDKLRIFVRGNLRFMARHKDHYRRNPDERLRKRSLIRALLALPPEGAEAIERDRFPTAEAMAVAATRAGLSLEIVVDACRSCIFFFGSGGLMPRPAPSSTCVIEPTE